MVEDSSLQGNNNFHEKEVLEEMKKERSLRRSTKQIHVVFGPTKKVSYYGGDKIRSLEFLH
ncbi:hypothetical protein H5410_038430 [Solanum commersonii]|uniref:Uncharacterized protein n=1 Tax=Solanum commersonii TaxID=4109 RepID=A0A9J5YDX7_SOLCO|nr:hypothetical protein H5410_038430 [Solanum commersonii]